MLAIWQGIARTDNEAPTNAMLFLALLPNDESEMLSTERWRTSCKSCLAIPLPVVLQAISKVVKAVTIQLAMLLLRRILGTDRRRLQVLVVPLHGSRAAVKKEAATNLVQVLRHGNNNLEVAKITIATLLLVALLLGNNKLLLHLLPKIMAMQAINKEGTVPRMATNSHRHLHRLVLVTS